MRVGIAPARRGGSSTLPVTFNDGSMKKAQGARLTKELGALGRLIVILLRGGWILP
jgi:hypothetical protein